MTTVSLLVDNDVLIKCACYSLLDQIRPPVADCREMTGILGAAPFVVRSYLRKRGTINDRSSAQQCFESYLSTVVILEPTDQELELASTIEETATLLSLDLDGGESQLCAIAVSRISPLLLTGDKRAIKGAESLRREVAVLSSLRGRVVCLEQAIMGITMRMGPNVARAMICAEPGVDKSLSICFECSSQGQSPEFSPVGLASYVRDLRLAAPTLLYEPDAL
jgi:hypothetical protein